MSCLILLCSRILLFFYIKKGFITFLHKKPPNPESCQGCKLYSTITSCSISLLILCTVYYAAFHCSRWSVTDCLSILSHFTLLNYFPQSLAPQDNEVVQVFSIIDSRRVSQLLATSLLDYVLQSLFPVTSKCIYECSLSYLIIWHPL
jgi:hypothetical protein